MVRFRSTCRSVIAGVLELMTALMTRWDRTEAEPTYRRRRRTPAAR